MNDNEDKLVLAGSLQGIVRHIEARVAELEGAAARAEALDAKAIALRARIAELEKEREEWKHCYEAMNARHDTALARIAELEKERDEAYSRVTVQRDAAEQGVRNWTERAEKAEARVAELEKALAHEGKRKGELADLARGVLKSQDVMQIQTNEAYARIAELEKERDEAYSQVTVAREQYEAHAAELEKERDESRAAHDATKDRLGSRLLTAENRISELEKAEARVAELEALENAEMGALRARISELEQDLSDRERKSAEYAREAEHFGLRCRELEKERDGHAQVYAFGQHQMLSQLSAPQVLTDEECDRLRLVFEDATDAAEDAEGQAELAGIRALLAAAGRMYVAPENRPTDADLVRMGREARRLSQPESKGPATDEEIREVNNDIRLSPMGGLRAVYDLGWQQGFSVRARPAPEGYFVPFVADDALMENMAKAVMANKHNAAWSTYPERWKGVITEALSALPQLYVAATADHDLDPPQPVHLNEEKLIAAYPLGKPERLPFRGLTKEDARRLRNILENGALSADSQDAFDILASAMGVES